MERANLTWHLLGGEYPPGCGGVGDYTERLASALAGAGDQVHVWIPRPASAGPSPVRVHALPDAFGAHSRAALLEGWTRDPGIVLLQYVPNALGLRGANLSFCRWLESERHAGIDVRVMFHEPYFYFSPRKPWRNVLAIVQRRMAAILVRASTRVYVSTETWRRYLAPHGAADAVPLAIPSTVPADPSAADVAQFRARFGGSRAVVGHFGTFGDDMARALLPVAARILEDCPDATLALIGDRSEAFQRDLGIRAPAAAARCIATGRLPGAAVAAALQACDLVVQPYPDGVTTRRTTIMAALRNGVAALTTEGALTEDVWRTTGAAVLVPSGDASRLGAATRDLLSDAARRRKQGRRGADVYDRLFSIERTVAALRASD